jgi:hypothetical protein
VHVPITAAEKGLFEAIDGNFSIGNIVESSLPATQNTAQLDQVQTLFALLWLYDQVVFDASRINRLNMDEK